jgi:hypothetical protein
MSQDRLPPPEQEACLVRLRPSSQKGGTIVAEDVTDLATHDRRLCEPDGYRPRFCPSCGEKTLHVQRLPGAGLASRAGPAGGQRRAARVRGVRGDLAGPAGVHGAAPVA